VVNLDPNLNFAPFPRVFVVSPNKSRSVNVHLKALLKAGPIVSVQVPFHSLGLLWRVEPKLANPVRDPKYSSPGFFFT